MTREEYSLEVELGVIIEQQILHVVIPDAANETCIRRQKSFSGHNE